MRESVVRRVGIRTKKTLFVFLAAIIIALYAIPAYLTGATLPVTPRDDHNEDSDLVMVVFRRMRENLTTFESFLWPYGPFE